MNIHKNYRFYFGNHKCASFWNQLISFEFCFGESVLAVFESVYSTLHHARPVLNVASFPRRIKEPDDAISISGVKGTACTSNNINEVERTLGIEAARFVLNLIG